MQPKETQSKAFCFCGCWRYRDDVISGMAILLELNTEQATEKYQRAEENVRKMMELSTP